MMISRVGRSGADVLRGLSCQSLAACLAGARRAPRSGWRCEAHRLRLYRRRPRWRRRFPRHRGAKRSCRVLCLPPGRPSPSAPSVLKPRILESSITTVLTAPGPRASSFSSSMSRIMARLCGGGNVDPARVFGPSAAGSSMGSIQADMRAIEVVRDEGRVMHRQAQAVGDGVPDEDGGLVLRPSPPSRHAVHYRGGKYPEPLRRSSQRGGGRGPHRSWSRLGLLHRPGWKASLLSKRCSMEVIHQENPLHPQQTHGSGPGPGVRI